MKNTQARGILSKFWEQLSSEQRESYLNHVEKSMQAFSPFGMILPDRLINWSEDDWELGAFISHAAMEAYELDEMSEEGYIAMKRMMAFLINPRKEELTRPEFIERLKELYELRKNS